MKSFTQYKLMLIGILLSLTVALSAQCPFTATITTTDAGGCGNANGSVFFSAVPTTAGSIVGTYYLVRLASDNTLVTSANNTNPEVALPQGSYIAEVKVQCTSGSQSSWTKPFTINQSTTSKIFTGTYAASSSRLTSLNAVPSGMLAYTFSGTGPYTLDIIEYPAAYKGPYHFENIGNGTFKIENLPAGSNYKVRMTNGCMVTTDGPRTIINTSVDLPPSTSFYYYLYNTQGGGIPSSAPTTDYKTIYLSMYSGYSPPDYWAQSISKDVYEFGWYYKYDDAGNLSSESAATITNWKPLSLDATDNRVDCKYTIAQMQNATKKQPSIVVRLKKAPTVMQDYGAQSLYFSPYTIYKQPSTVDCRNVDIKVPLNNQRVLTFPLDIQIKTYAGVVMQTHTVTDADMIKKDYTFTNIDVSQGYKIDYICKGDATVAATYNAESKSITSYGDLIPIYYSRPNIASNCQSNYAYIYLSDVVDLRGATIKYTGSIPLPDINQEFTVPTDLANVPYIYLTEKKGGTPWSNSEPYTSMIGGTYTWSITIPCGGSSVTYIKSITLSAPTTNTVAIDTNKFKPKTISSSTCGFVEIDLGAFSTIKDMSKVNGNAAITYFSLCSKANINTSVLGNFFYSRLGSGDGVYYDGTDTNYFATSTTGFTSPKIRVSRPGTYYLVAATGLSLLYSSAEGSCFLVKEFTITDGDIKGTLDLKATAAYYCSQDKTSGIIFVQRQGSNTGNQFIFKVQNNTLTYNKSITSADIQQTFDGIDVGLHGTQFSVSVEPLLNCSSTPSVALISLNEVGNSATFVKQNMNSDCYGTVNIELEGVAYTAASYKWKDITGAVLSNTNLLQGSFATGTRLFLEVTFEVTGPGGAKSKCGIWTKEYVVQGVALTEYYWRSNAVSNDWNNRNNWNDKNGVRPSTIPGNCSCAYIPATVNTYYPDLATASPVANVTDIYFEYGAQLYNQHKLTYRNAYVSYNTGYYSTLPTPAPTTLVQPGNSVTQVTGSADNKATVPFANLPIMQRARWYMLSTPLKGMYAADFQLAAKPYVIQRYYKNMAASPLLLATDGFTVTPTNTIKLSDYNNAIALWFPPYTSATGASDQKTLESLKGSIRYPYFYPYLANDEIISLRPDLYFDRSTNIMAVSKFDMQSLALSDPSKIDRSTKSSRFVYEDDATNAIPTGDTYTVSIAADTERTNGEVMIGNPFMAPLDFDKFLLANAGVISTSYRLIVNGATKQYDQANPGIAGSLSKYIAPMQSFIIKLVNPRASAALKFPVSATATQDVTTIKVKVQ